MKRTTAHLFTAIACAGGSVVSVTAAEKRPGTVDVLKAETVVKQIRVHDQGTDIRYTLDDDKADTAGDKLQPGQVFVTQRIVKVTFQQLNPLMRRVNVKVQGVDNASKDTVAKLVEAIAGIPAIVKPSSADTEAIRSVIATRGPAAAPAAPDCNTEIRAALAYVSKLDALLFSELTSAARLKTEYEDRWAKVISDGFSAGKSGQAAVGDGVAAIKSYEDELKDQIQQAANSIAEVDKNATLKPAAQCEQYAVAVYQFIRLTQPHLRLAQLRKLLQTIDDLQVGLAKDFGQPTQWIERDFIAAKDIVVTPERDADVSISVAPLTVSASESALSLKEGDTASVVFTVQYDSGWVTEMSIGLTAGFVTRPKFATSKNARGETIVAQSDESNVSIDPTVMVNFVPRGGGATLIRPMVQIGASVSKETPAIFLGGGWRIFGGTKGGVGVGGGLMLAWVKQLDKLSVGEVVSGTKDIDADVKFNSQPKPRFYFSIQYKF